MSYTYLLEQGEESSAECFSGIDPSVLSRLNHTAAKCCCNDSETEYCPGSRFGTTCEHSPALPIEDSSTSCAVDSPAKTSVSLAKEPGSTVNAPASGLSSPASFAKFDPDTCTWRTVQRSLLGGFVEFSQTWPKWGSIVGGVAYRLKTPSGLVAHRQWIISAKESGSSESIGTPTTCHTGRSEEFKKGRRPTPQEIATLTVHTPSANEPGIKAERLVTKDVEPGKIGQRAYDKHTGRLCQVGLSQQVQLMQRMPTPCRSDATGGPGNSGRQGGLNLRTAVQRVPTPRRADGEHLGTMPTETTRRRTEAGQANLSEFIQETVRVPTPHGFSKDGKSNGPSGNELGRAVNQMQRVPTPAAQDAKNSTLPPSQGGRDSVPGFMIRDGQTGGSLNPSWVEWLMGWPIGWTDLKPLETDKYQQWLRSHGSCFLSESKNKEPSE